MHAIQHKVSSFSQHSCPKRAESGMHHTRWWKKRKARKDRHTKTTIWTFVCLNTRLRSANMLFLLASACLDSLSQPALVVTQCRHTKSFRGHFYYFYLFIFYKYTHYGTTIGNVLPNSYKRVREAFSEGLFCVCVCVSLLPTRPYQLCIRKFMCIRV